MQNRFLSAMFKGLLYNANPFQEVCFLRTVGHLLHILIK